MTGPGVLDTRTPRAHVLVAEDDLETREALADALRDEGYDVVAVVDGRAAIMALSARAFDVVVTDVQMPGADGVAVLRAAKDLAPDTEVVVTTAHASLRIAVDCLRAGAADLIQKPLPLEAVLETVARVAARRRLLGASQALLATHDPVALPRAVVDAVVTALEAHAASLLLAGGDDRLHLAHAHGLPPGLAVVPIALGERIAGRVARDRVPALLGPDPAGEPRFAGVAGHGRAGSSVVYPLAADARLVGVLCASRAPGAAPFDHEDLRRAGVLATQAVLALENARLVREQLALERLASVGTLAAAVSHEINNPLTYVLASLEFARDALRGAAAGPERDAAQAVDDAHHGAARIRDIVRDAIALARADRSARTLFDVGDAVRAALRVAGPQLDGRAHVEVHLAADAHVAASPGPLAQVVTNLLVNAAQAMADLPPDARRVAVRSRREGGEVVIEVADTGRGIAPEHMGRLFEPFFTTKRAGLGVGLGLAISREIVRRYDGELRASSVPGRGATFAIHLPVAAPARDSDRAPPRGDAPAR